MQVGNQNLRSTCRQTADNYICIPLVKYNIFFNTVYIEKNKTVSVDLSGSY